MFRGLRKLFGSPRSGPWFNRKGDGAQSEADDGPTALRRWDAAKTDRLNKAHWGQVTGRTINTDLSAYHETLRTRVEFELANNSDAEGVVNTHIVDVIGEDGPVLQVQSDNKAYNEALEKAWRAWWAKPDINGRLSGVDILQLWLRSLWSAGEYLAQIIVDDKAEGAVKARILCLHARRLGMPMNKAGDPTVFMGVKRDKYGKPLAYMIGAPQDRILEGLLPTDFDEVKAEDIIHEFKVLEPGQVRGVPWLVTGLQAIADLRDYDGSVLEAARAAAEHGVLLHTNHPESTYLEVNESAPIERGMMTTLPPGWDAKQMIPTQPSTGYVEYRGEQLRKVGRPVGMPLMIIKLDSSGHNYSSARFDAQVYERATKSLRAWLTRRTLNRLVDLVAAEVMRAVNPPDKLPERPAEVKYHWNWPAFPHVDPAKEDKATTERMKNTTSSMRDECADRGNDWEEVLKQQALEQAKREKLGLPPLAEMLGVSAESEPVEDIVEEKMANAKN